MSQNPSRTKKIVVIGGGTGLPVILEELKNHNTDITAIVTVADDGGSSGIIRDHVNIVPPGDIRNCMIALSDMPKLEKDIFQYRFHSKDSLFRGTPSATSSINLDCRKGAFSMPFGCCPL